MLQSAKVDMLGVIGNIKRLNGSGTQVTIYINKIDDYGNQIGKEMFYVTMFHNAERYLLSTNPQNGDQIMIRNGLLSNRKIKDDRTGFEYYQTSIVCNYGDQIHIIAKSNHQTLKSRADANNQVNNNVYPNSSSDGFEGYPH
ncbi:MAG: hypothetical protein E6R13_06665 [Spirochaetes bacterium]|nr:MAG: hypothetical protein E6R13_06665 [Spirochaetota bacterium]